jgi:hypothetical protein
VPPGYKVDPVNDLWPVCPNCHAMIHRGPGPALTVEELQRLLGDDGALIMNLPAAPTAPTPNG